jgi:hypothetical protein
MKKPWVILLALGLLLGLAAAFWLGRSQREPEYKGKRLSEWVRTAPSPYGWDRGETERAIRHMGTNALPWLLDWLNDEPPPPWKIKVLKIVQKFPKRLGGGFAQQALQPNYVRFNFASTGFWVLGRDARGAIPGLVRLAKNPKCRNGGRNAVDILTHLGDEAIPELIAILRAPVTAVRRPVIDYFHLLGTGGLGTNANAAAEAMVFCLNDSDHHIRSDAALALATFALRPKVVVPALAISCGDAVSEVRQSALSALAVFGEAARPARLAIVQALHDPDANVRSAAAMALEQIPE